jgi:hypothetical protein
MLNNFGFLGTRWSWLNGPVHHRFGRVKHVLWADFASAGMVILFSN